MNLPAGSSLSEDDKSFEHAVDVRPADIDANGHVNNVVYLSWVQDVALAHWWIVVDRRGWAGTPIAETFWVVRRHELEYLRPAFPGDRVIVRTWVGEVTAATFERLTEVRRPEPRNGQPAAVLARARSLWCVLDVKTGRPRRVGPELRAFFGLGETPARA